MVRANPLRRCVRTLAAVCLLIFSSYLRAQTPEQPLPNAPSAQTDPATLKGTITDTDKASIPGAKITLYVQGSKAPLQTIETDTGGAFTFASVPTGTYSIKVTAPSFTAWKVESIILLPGQIETLTPIELGVEALTATVDAISVEDLAEQQITAEEHQRILGVLPNFFVSYERNAAPLTNRQKFKLALVVSRDPLTFFTTGVNAGIEQATGAFDGYGYGYSGYAERYAANYGDRLSATFLGAAVFPSLFHQDPRYFYNGRGSIVHRALYAISTVVICKGDNGKWQPNYSNVLGNLASGGISALYYPNSSRHDIQTSVDNIFIGIGEGSIGTLFQEFLLRHITHGAPPKS